MAQLCLARVLPLIVSLTLHLSTCTATHYPKTIYVDDLCGQKFLVDKDVKMRLKSWGPLPTHMQCEVDLEPKNGDRLVARMTTYHMDSINVPLFTDTCIQQAILLSGQLTGKVWGDNGYCRTLRPTEQYNLGKNGTFGYRTNTYFVSPADVVLLVSEVRDKNRTGACPDGCFDCHRQNYCIDEEVACNGYDDCGNDEDEIEGCGLTIGVIVGIAFGIIAFVFIVIMASVLFLECR